MIDSLLLPTPIQDITNLFPCDGKISVHIKRDDLIHPFISGNKWRKLKYVIAEVQRRNADGVVTFGGAYSNHLLATACAGAMFNIKTIGFIRGDSFTSNPVLSLCRIYGMDLRFVDRGSYKNKRALYEAFCAQEPNHDYEFVDEGGAHPLALKGCEEIVEEIKHEGHSYDHIFCACGTATTIAGISKAVQKSKAIPKSNDQQKNSEQTQVHAIAVLKNGEFLLKNAADLYNNTNITLHTEFHEGGYAKSSPALLNYVKSFVQKSGILIEPIYTGKLFYGVHQLIEKNYFKEGARILLIHSGGLTGILGVHESFVS
jgi:1-aminocyclopropane-1-carboxylate deaminase